MNLKNYGKYIKNNRNATIENYLSYISKRILLRNISLLIQILIQRKD